jgi:hypothetical protein
MRPYRMTFVLMALLYAVMLSTCQGDDLNVELDVFSGLTNPVWNLTEEEAKEFLDMLGELAEVERREPHEEGLGYRGLIVRDPSASASFEIVSVFNSFVVVSAANSTSSYLDEDRMLELWLLETGEGEIDDELFREIRAEIVGIARTKK